MKTNTKILVWALCMSMLCLTRCEENLQTPPTTSDFPPVIFTILTQEQLDNFRKAGMPFFEGNQPRLIANFVTQVPSGITFVIEHQCISDNVARSNIDSAFSSYSETLTVLPDSNNNYRVAASYVSARDQGSGIGFASGDPNNNFSLFFKVNGLTDGIAYEAIWVITGSLQFSDQGLVSGLSNIYDAFLMTQKGPDPLNQVADVGTIRVFRDPDLTSNVAIQNGSPLIKLKFGDKSLIAP